MSLAALFGMMACAGAVCLWTGLGAGLIARAKARHRLVLHRLAGLSVVPPAQDTPLEVVALLRDEAPKGWRRFLPRPPSGERTLLPLYMTLLIFLGVPLLAAVVAHRFGFSVAFGVALSFPLAFGIWLWQVRRKLRHRSAQIEEAIPEAMDLIVRALRVGVPVATALQTAGQELIGPIAQELRETSDRIRYGQETVPALRDMAERSHSQGLRFFAAAVSIQLTTGGNLAEVLERLAAIARARMQLRRKVNSITAEAKWSGRFLSAFPLIAVAVLLTVNPAYFADIAEQRFFYPMLAVVGVLLLMNILFMRWLIQIE